MSTHLAAESDSTPDQVVAMDPELVAALDRLRRNLIALGPVVVAFSGGADSAFLAWLAAETLGRTAAPARTAVSPSLPSDELADCHELAQDWQLDWAEVETAELDDPAYRANGADRCGHCKAALMDALEPLAIAAGATVVLGVNLDDMGDHRPGQVAAAERGARFPLLDAGFSKAMVRKASRHFGLPTWDKPAAACLASRLPYGTPVTVGVLGQVERLEAALRKLGFDESRARHYGDTVRIEFPVDRLADAVGLRAELVGAALAAGYQRVTLDLEGLRSGNLNADIGFDPPRVQSPPKRPAP